MKPDSNYLAHPPKENVFRIDFTMRISMIRIILNLSICLFLEAKTLEAFIDQPRRRMHRWRASFRHVDAREVIV